MKFTKISTKNITQLMQLEKRMHPSRFVFTREEWFERLHNMDKCNCNFSWGITDKYGIVGYFLAHMGTSYIEGSTEDVIIVADMVIAPEYKRHLFELIRAFVEELNKRKINNTSIEALATEKTYKLLKDHSNIFLRFGYELKDSCFIIHNNRELIWIRLDPKK